AEEDRDPRPLPRDGGGARRPASQFLAALGAAAIETANRFSSGSFASRNEEGRATLRCMAQRSLPPGHSHIFLYCIPRIMPDQTLKKESPLAKEELQRIKGGRRGFGAFHEPWRFRELAQDESETFSSTHAVFPLASSSELAN